MKKIFIILLIFNFNYKLSSQVTFNKRPSFSYEAAGLLSSIISTDSCYYVIGVVRDTLPPSNTSSLFAKFDLNGNLVFDKVLASQERTFETFISPLIQEGDSFVLIGQTFDFTNQKAMFLKYNPSGDTILYKDFFHPNHPIEDFFSPRSIQKTPDGGYVFCSWGSAQDFTIGNVLHQNTDIFLTKIDNLGNVQWENSFGNNKWEIATSLVVSIDGKIILGGTRSNLNTTNQNYQWQTYIIGLDSLGEEEWSYLSPINEHRDAAKEMVLLGDGSLIVASGFGYEQDRPSVNEMWFEKSIFKLNPDHELEWEKEFKDTYFSGRSQTTNLIGLSDNSGFIVAGTETYNPSQSWIQQTYGWLMKFDENGDSLWTRRYIYPISTKTHHIFHDLKETPDGGLILCGESRDNDDDVDIPQQSWLLKLDQYGCLVPGCHLDVSTDEAEEAPIKISIYPNPTTDYLNVYQQFSEQGLQKKGSYRIVDSQGRLMEAFPIGQNDATLIIPVWNWAKGSYFFQLLVEGKAIQTNKFTVQ